MSEATDQLKSWHILSTICTVQHVRHELRWHLVLPLANYGQLLTNKMINQAEQLAQASELLGWDFRSHSDLQHSKVHAFS